MSTYVKIEAVKSDDRGRAGCNSWEDTDDIGMAIDSALHRFQRTWDLLGHGGAVTYRITVAPECSPRRTTRNNKPLPVEDLVESATYPGG